MDQEELSRAVAAARNQRAAALRLRAAHLYHVEGLTQNEIAAALDIGRVTVVRLLNEARARGEVRFWIEGETGDCVALERRLEAALSLERAVVCPAPVDPANTDRMIGFAAGMALSQAVFDGARIGLGWGRTLHHALATLSRPGLRDVKVVSLLGGIVRARDANPAEFAWRMATALDAECVMFTAPAIVDGPETRSALIERCGLDTVIAEARDLDLALVGVGAVADGSTSLACAREMLRRDVRRELVEAGAVGDVCLNFFDRAGRLVAHPLNAQVMSVPVDCVASARRRVIAAGGYRKTGAILAACRMLAASLLVTDEATAVGLLSAAEDRVAVA